MNLFRELNEQETEEFQQWARDNYVIGTKVDSSYHPVVQEESKLMNAEAGEFADMELLMSAY